MEAAPNQEQQVQETNVQENEFLKKQENENRKNNLKNRELQESKKRFFNVAKKCIGWLTVLVIVATIFMCLFSTHYATPVRGVEAEITNYRKNDRDRPASVSFQLKNTNHFKVTVDFFITYRDSKISRRVTVVLAPFEEKNSWGNDLTLYKDINFVDNISKDDLEINMTVTCNSHSYFGFLINR